MISKIFHGQDTSIYLDYYCMYILKFPGDKGKSVCSYLLKPPFPLGIKCPIYTNT